jgi:hypothetical protein
MNRSIRAIARIEDSKREFSHERSIPNRSGLIIDYETLPELVEPDAGNPKLSRRVSPHTIRHDVVSWGMKTLA